MKLLFRLAHEPSRTLLLVQLAALLLYPWFDTGHGQGVLAALSVGVLGAAVWMVRRSPREAWIAAALAVAGKLAHAAYRFTGVATLGVVGAAGYAAAFFYSAAALIAYMMQDERTTTDELWAACATYMLFVDGFAWAFSGAQLLQPGAFVVPGAAVQQPLTWVQALFLSATNMSATGLTDIYPATPHARVLVIVEQWTGVMYLTVVVARMAGLLRKR
jgi:hypothetical protein